MNVQITLVDKSIFAQTVNAETVLVIILVIATMVTEQQLIKRNAKVSWCTHVACMQQTTLSHHTLHCTALHHVMPQHKDSVAYHIIPYHTHTGPIPLNMVPIPFAFQKLTSVVKTHLYVIVDDVKTFLVAINVFVLLDSFSIRKLKVVKVGQQHQNKRLFMNKWQTISWSLIIVLNFLSADDNECKNRRQCIDGVCINSIGSFRCQCPPELTLHESGRICQGSLCYYIEGNGGDWGSYCLLYKQNFVLFSHAAF